jgi:hypothetical protein
MLLGSMLLATVTTARAQEAPEMFKDVPKSHWAYSAVEKLGKAGVLRGRMVSRYTQYFYSGPNEFTSYEFATVLHDGLRRMKQRPSERSSALTVTPSQAGLLKRMCAEFQFVLTAMGISQRSAEATLDAATRADEFRDVPRRHWSYQAVERLRKQGVIQGYPGGTFRGDR